MYTYTKTHTHYMMTYLRPSTNVVTSGSVPAPDTFTAIRCHLFALILAGSSGCQNRIYSEIIDQTSGSCSTQRRENLATVLPVRIRPRST